MTVDEIRKIPRDFLSLEWAQCVVWLLEQAQQKQSAEARAAELETENRRLWGRNDLDVHEGMAWCDRAKAAEARAEALEAENGRLRKALSWAVDLLDMYDEMLLSLGEPKEKVYSQIHLDGKERARAALAPQGEQAQEREP